MGTAGSGPAAAAPGSHSGKGYMTYRETGKSGARVLEEAGVPEYAVDAALLLREAAGFDMTQSLMHADDEIPAEVQKRYESMISRRAGREPLQHITGYQTFMGYDFHTGPQALVPRQDTEVLVMEALAFLRAYNHTVQNRQPRVMDVCTGTGCIVESLALEYPGPAYLGSDISAEALALARRNAQLLQVDVELVETDLLTGLDGPFDLIVSNPPYIPETVIRELDPEVRDHDPHLALSGGEDGLTIYRRLIPEAYSRLRAGGALMLEIGADQAADVSILMRTAGFTALHVLQDPSGHDRVVTGLKPDGPDGIERKEMHV